MTKKPDKQSRNLAHAARSNFDKKTGTKRTPQEEEEVERKIAEILAEIEPSRRKKP